MMMEEDLRAILDGRPIPIQFDKEDLQDIDLKHLPSIPERNVLYIVCAVLFDDEDRVLLVQEAKQNFYGQWSLPAGKLEPGETIMEGAKREVREETGLECEMTSLLCATLQGMWMRFTFIGKATGGKLKTVNEKDSESLQAGFFHQHELPKELRCCNGKSDEVLRLISVGRQYQENKTYMCHLAIHPHKYVTYRFVIVHKDNASKSVSVLASTKGDKSCIPSRLGNIVENVPVAVFVSSILNTALSISLTESSFDLCGLLGLEHRGTGRDEDGVCITLLIRLRLPEGQSLARVTTSEYAWHNLTDSQVLDRLTDGCHQNIAPVFVT